MRYAIAGLLLNAFGYTLYLGITWLSGSPGLAVSICYPIGVLIGYIVHASFSFQHSAQRSDGIFRFVVAHLGGYLSNLAILWLGVGFLKFPHYLVQVFAIFMVAIQLFVTFKFFVFRSPQSRSVAAATANAHIG
jgi:putative flippase GtrA